MHILEIELFSLVRIEIKSWIIMSLKLENNGDGGVSQYGNE